MSSTAKVTFTPIDETLSTAEGREARAAAENDDSYGMAIFPTFHADTDAPAFEIRRTVDTAEDALGYVLVERDGATSWADRGEAEAVMDEEITRAAYADGSIYLADTDDSYELGKQVDITVDGEYGDHDEAKIVLTTAQLGKLAQLVKLVDLGAVELGGDVDGAQFAREFIAEVEGAIDTILSEKNDA